MTTNGVSLVNGDSHTNGDLKPNGIPKSHKSPQPDGLSQANGIPQGPKKGQSRNLSSYAVKHKLAPHFIGGNHLDAAPASSVKDFVANHDGHTVITNVSPYASFTYALSSDEVSLGSYRKQRNCCGQRDQISAEMGLRDIWR